jgi:hypothetical protein
MKHPGILGCPCTLPVGASLASLGELHSGPQALFEPNAPAEHTRDVPARYLLRLGMGEAELETEQDFSRVGRVNAMLARRLELLAQVGGQGLGCNSSMSRTSLASGG